MARADYRDTTDTVPIGKRRIRRPFQTRQLLLQLDGTFCFEAGDAFACGVDATLTKGQKLGVKGSLKARLPNGIEAGIEVSYEETVEQALRFQAGRCERCQLMACREAARLQKWSCWHGVGRWVWHHTKTRIRGGSKVYLPDCVVTGLCSGCSGELVPVPAPPTRVHDTGTAADSVTVTVAVVDLARTPTPNMSDEAVALVEGLGETDEEERTEPPPQVTVLQGVSEPVSLTASGPDDFRMAFLTEDAGERVWGALRLRQGRIPIIAAAPSVVAPRAHVTWRAPEHLGSNKLEVLREDDLETRSGRYTAIVGEIEVATTQLEERGGWGLLSLELVDEATGRRAHREVLVSSEGSTQA